MKSPPLASLVTPGAKPLGLSRSVALPVHDAAHHSQVEWRLERSDEGRTPTRRGRPSRTEEEAGEASITDKTPARGAATPLDERSSRVALTDAGDATDAVSAEHAYQLWKGRVWRFASRLGVSTEALEDATQDVFTAVFRRWNDFRGHSTRRTWVLGFVPRVASSYRRRLRQRGDGGFAPSDSAISVAAEPSGGVEHDPFESTARREATRIVRTFLDGLPEKDRQLFVLVDLEDASVVEAAAILELGIRRAYKSLERVRRSLEAALVRHRAAESRRLP
jgi:RNA polymerase sigma-70 factor (ECF subfamily)